MGLPKLLSLLLLILLHAQSSQPFQPIRQLTLPAIRPLPQPTFQALKSNSNSNSNSNGNEPLDTIDVNNNWLAFAPIFISSHWNESPVLLKNSFRESPDDPVIAGSSSWPTKEDVYDLAADEDCEVRMITHDPSEDHWALELGPFAPEELRPPPTIPHSLVVNDVDRFLPHVADWMDANFNFFPNWRRDDGQISLAGEDGGIGFHVDSYDVFLVQVSGERNWTVELDFLSENEEIDRLDSRHDVRILRPPNSPKRTVSVTLKPGDMLYLPPRIPHCGTATTPDCMTLSVGFRSPSASEMLSSLAEEIGERVRSGSSSDERYSESNPDDLLENASRGLLTRSSSEVCKRILLDAINGVEWDEWFGKHVTESKRFRMDYPQPAGEEQGLWGDPEAAVSSILDAGRGMLFQAEGLTFAYNEKGDLFIDGNHFPGISTRVSRIICDNRCLTQSHFEHLLPDLPRALLKDLVSRGFLYGCDGP
ncbi:hypothetical protein TrVE_jg6233 [Triparma verrucosa]|uniref:Bifunctional lysine-specific demethylase and histidyl-hydroxylase n=1 Tax=Triparma verrucosa TaxID=1606542 RepID=A0A9W7F2A7_9STRA|nr:hypothetical protein TrVE_jg6233 [Triparma verrucosa]